MKPTKVESPDYWRGYDDALHRARIGVSEMTITIPSRMLPALLVDEMLVKLIKEYETK